MKAYGAAAQDARGCACAESGEGLAQGLNVVAFDAAHSGLPCRSPIHCDECFRVPDHATLEDLQAVGRTRNAHELSAHAYVHIVIERPYAYQSGIKWGKQH